jgi:hypothetical protein
MAVKEDPPGLPPSKSVKGKKKEEEEEEEKAKAVPYLTLYRYADGLVSHREWVTSVLSDRCTWYSVALL